MNPKEFKPVTKWHTTTNYTGSGDIKPLPVTRFDDGTLNSVWALPSVWERVKFLFRGELTLRIYGNSQPPVAVVAGDIVEDALGRQA